ncbi:MAG: CCA tRNA nucleotidyltransferase [Bauldia sp.]|nr:CCA tRNA nucleotidyltransferase [Bauldia sp.]
MTAEPRAPSLKGAAWLEAPAAQTVLRLLASEGEEARVVGGAVRDALAGLPVREIDIATTATPERVEQRAVRAGIKVVPTGAEHGTLTLVTGGQSFEVTTLREDVETDGRHAVVRYGRDWRADAARRDFTINALSVDADGIVHDPLGGLADVLERRVRFVGPADLRIAEDRLRLLRFFRFFAQFAEGAPDAEGLAASARARTGLRDLSAERIAQEMRKLVVAPRAAETAVLMQDHGVLPVITGSIADLAGFARLCRLEAEWGAAPTVALRLAALTCRVREDAERIAGRLRLANAERERMVEVLDAVCEILPGMDERAGRAALYRMGPSLYRDAVLLRAARAKRGDAPTDWRGLWSLPERWRAQRFPLSGGDVLGFGVRPGPDVGALLREVEAWWIAEDFAPDRHALVKRLQQMAAQQQ